MARLTESDGNPYKADSRAAETVPEWRTSTDRFGPLLMPEMHIHGSISGAHALRPVYGHDYAIAWGSIEGENSEWGFLVNSDRICYIGVLMEGHVVSEGQFHPDGGLLSERSEDDKWVTSGIQ